ncbi:MAG: purine-nucleoside phosphorylase [Eubacterium sp.]|nr:purine-nucleoside phosphorylase [Eubacterium sp.]HBE08978.1 purine-nucleoside phosphorylase [Lachnospiraceae bacterium]
MKKTEYEELIERSVDLIKSTVEKTLPGFSFYTGIVLGSGLGELAEKVENAVSISFRDIPGLAVSTVEGHKGAFVIGRLYNKNVILMQGRVHFYEGYEMQLVVLPIRIMARLGIKHLLLTNSAGGIGEENVPGSFMVLTDHISSFVPSPLIGENYEKFGPRFPDMSEIYNHDIAEKIYNKGNESGLKVTKGVYLQTTGPQYETPTEIRFYKMIGADAIGMSTAVEAIAARHAGVTVNGISCITNFAAGLSDTKLSHEEVKNVADRVSDDFKKLVRIYLEEVL